MRKHLLPAACGVVLALSLGGCGTYNKILKSGEPELIYREAFRYFEAGKYQRATTLFEQAKPYFDGTSREDSIAYYMARSYFKMKDFDTSAVEFDDFRRKYSRSVFIEDVEGMYALSYYYMSPAPERDQTMTVQALSAIQDFIGRYPNSTRRAAFDQMVRELTQKLHDKAFLNARTYFTIGRYKSAVVALKNALKKYPDSNHREEILYLIVKSSFRLADNSIPSLQRDRFLDMLDSYYTFVGEFPESKYRKELSKMEESAKRYLAANREEGDPQAENTHTDNDNTDSDHGDQEK